LSKDLYCSYLSRDLNFCVLFRYPRSKGWYWRRINREDLLTSPNIVRCLEETFWLIESPLHSNVGTYRYVSLACFSVTCQQLYHVYHAMYARSREEVHPTRIHLYLHTYRLIWPSIKPAQWSCIRLSLKLGEVRVGKTMN